MTLKSKFIENGTRFSLTTPTELPNSASYLWNRSMMVHVNCQGYAVGQYMNPEPKKYAHVPNLAATSFMQPEQPYFAHHPGRFFYIRDDETGELYSTPYAPMKKQFESFKFEPGLSDIRWVLMCMGLEVTIIMSLSDTHSVELWNITINNKSGKDRKISLVPYFPVGYMSWMNMGATFDDELCAAICTSITPYQKLEDYEKNKHLKDITFLATDQKPDFYELSQPQFEGHGGLHNPDALQHTQNLHNGNSEYEMPTCAMQYCWHLPATSEKALNLIFGPALDKTEISSIIDAHFDHAGEKQNIAYQNYITQGQGVIRVETGDELFDNFVNHWLPRQVYYHGDTNRLTTDPQTRNYLQDGMGMVYIDPCRVRNVVLTSLRQQSFNGEMPDGILLTSEAELKYINQIPHTDHSVWLALIIEAYLNETDDYDLLSTCLPWQDNDNEDTVLEHMNRAMLHLCNARDERGLPFIAQGDWCDPMNMVGHKGKGVSGWLAQATSYALQVWIRISQSKNTITSIDRFQQISDELKKKTNQYFWQGDWYARGITDDGVTFGTPDDAEGRIFLNTQSWAFLAGIPSQEQTQKMLTSVDNQLDTPFGVMLCAPAFTAMRDDIGRVTQKWPGSGENGSVYNHAASFYAAGLLAINQPDRAFSVLRKMLSDPEQSCFIQRGQLPVYIPNYYRGAYYQHPDSAGRSSNLFNTGTGAWFYRLVIEELLGLKGCSSGLQISPQLPTHWKHIKVTRKFRGATINVEYVRTDSVSETHITCDGQRLPEGVLPNIVEGKIYQLIVELPK